MGFDPAFFDNRWARWGALVAAVNSEALATPVVAVHSHGPQKRRGPQNTTTQSWQDGPNLGFEF